jgi:hypothetical protein
MKFVTIRKTLPNGRGFETIVFPSAGSPDELPPMDLPEPAEPMRYGSTFAQPPKVPRNRPTARFSVDGVVAILALALLAAVGIVGGLA